VSGAVASGGCVFGVCVSDSDSVPSSTPLRNALAEAPSDRARSGNFRAPNMRRTMSRITSHSCPLGTFETSLQRQLTPPPGYPQEPIRPVRAAVKAARFPVTNPLPVERKTHRVPIEPCAGSRSTLANGPPGYPRAMESMNLWIRSLVMKRIRGLVASTS
jgi:hypothetical protein